MEDRYVSFSSSGTFRLTFRNCRKRSATTKPVSNHTPLVFYSWPEHRHAHKRSELAALDEDRQDDLGINRLLGFSLDPAMKGYTELP
jgi:uncharacterized protein YjiS (DUF1127 family)